MKHIGYSCIRNKNSKEISHSATLPIKAVDPLKPKGRIGVFYELGPAGDKFTIVERWEVESPSKSYKRAVNSSQSFEDGKIIIDPKWKPFGLNTIRLGLKRAVSQKASEIITGKYDTADQINAIVYDKETDQSTRFKAIKTIRDHVKVLKAEIDALDTVSDLDAWEQHDWPVI